MHGNFDFHKQSTSQKWFAVVKMMTFRGAQLTYLNRERPVRSSFTFKIQ